MDATRARARAEIQRPSEAKRQPLPRGRPTSSLLEPSTRPSLLLHHLPPLSPFQIHSFSLHNHHGSASAAQGGQSLSILLALRGRRSTCQQLILLALATISRVAAPYDRGRSSSVSPLADH